MMNPVLKMIASLGSRVRLFAGRGRGGGCPGLDRAGDAIPCGRKGRSIVRRISDTKSLELHWARIDTAPPAYELNEGTETLAFLCGEVDLRSISCARTADGDWTIAFERRGPLASHVVARSAETGVESATIELRPLKSRVLNFADGRRYKWAIVRWLPPLWEFAGADDKSLVTISAELLAPREQGTIVLSPEAIDLPDLPLLTVFALYIHLLGTHKQAAWAT